MRIITRIFVFLTVNCYIRRSPAKCWTKDLVGEIQFSDLLSKSNIFLLAILIDWPDFSHHRNPDQNKSKNLHHNKGTVAVGVEEPDPSESELFCCICILYVVQLSVCDYCTVYNRYSHKVTKTIKHGKLKGLPRPVIGAKPVFFWVFFVSVLQ